MHDLTFAVDLENIQKTLAIAMDDLLEKIDEGSGWRQEAWLGSSNTASFECSLGVK